MLTSKKIEVLMLMRGGLFNSYLCGFCLSNKKPLSSARGYTECSKRDNAFEDMAAAKSFHYTSRVPVCKYPSCVRAPLWKQLVGRSTAHGQEINAGASLTGERQICAACATALITSGEAPSARPPCAAAAVQPVQQPSSEAESTDRRSPAHSH